MKGISVNDLSQRCSSFVRAQLAAISTGRSVPNAQHYAQSSLVKESSNPQSMVHSDRPLLVRITRHGGRTLDTDNLAGGCKELRDAIASAFGRKGDSEKDGFTWIYAQKNSD